MRICEERRHITCGLFFLEFAPNLFPSCSATSQQIDWSAHSNPESSESPVQGAHSSPRWWCWPATGNWRRCVAPAPSCMTGWPHSWRSTQAHCGTSLVPSTGGSIHLCKQWSSDTHHSLNGLMLVDIQYITSLPSPVRTGLNFPLSLFPSTNHCWRLCNNLSLVLGHQDSVAMRGAPQME